MEHLRFLSWNSTGRSKDNALEDEQLMSKESGELETQLRRLYERQSKLRRWIIGLSILVGILALALLGAVSHSTQDSGGEQTVLSPVPRMPRTKVTFEEDKLFANGSFSFKSFVTPTWVAYVLRGSVPSLVKLWNGRGPHSGHCVRFTHSI